MPARREHAYADECDSGLGSSIQWSSASSHCSRWPGLGPGIQSSSTPSSSSLQPDFPPLCVIDQPRSGPRIYHYSKALRQSGAPHPSYVGPHLVAMPSTIFEESEQDIHKGLLETDVPNMEKKGESLKKYENVAQWVATVSVPAECGTLLSTTDEELSIDGDSEFRNSLVQVHNTKQINRKVNYHHKGYGRRLSEGKEEQSRKREVVVLHQVRAKEPIYYYSSSNNRSYYTEYSTVTSSSFTSTNIVFQDRKDRAIDRILSSLHFWLLDRLSEITCADGSSVVTSHTGRESSSAASDETTSSRALSKRPARQSEDEEGNQHGSDDDTPCKRRKQTARGTVDPSLLLACPYYKRNPNSFHGQRSSCAGPGWATVHRIKRHALPEYKCPRCCQTFKSVNDLSQHLLQENRCEVRQEESLEGFDKDTEKLLRSRKQFKGESSEVDRWNRVYRILFPDDETIPSPYYEYASNEGTGTQRSEMVEIFRDIQQQFPILMHQRLSVEIDEAIESVLGRQDQIVGIAQDVLSSVLERYNIPQSARERIAESNNIGNGEQLSLDRQNPALGPYLDEVQNGLDFNFGPEGWDDGSLFGFTGGDSEKSGWQDSGYGSWGTGSQNNAD